MFTFSFIISLFITNYITYVWLKKDLFEDNKNKNTFLTYGLSDVFVLTSGEKNKESDKKENKENKEVLKKQNFKIGNIIKLKFSKEKESVETIQKHRARRSISTYGFEEILPKEDTEYIITNIEEH